MNFISSYCTDKGMVKNTNQDSFAIKIANTNQGQVALAIVCDGMGGLQKGELASKEVVLSFERWFETKFKTMLSQGIHAEIIKEQWFSLVDGLNEALGQYGLEQNCKLGTTITAILLCQEKYYVIHVGDCRIYEIADTLQILTEDHTLIRREVKSGRMTEEEAKKDKRRNILLQCIGASETIIPDFYEGTVKENTIYMLCSDGFRHEISEDELLQRLTPMQLTSEEKMKAACEALTQLIRERKERDNSTVVLVRTY